MKNIKRKSISQLKKIADSKMSLYIRTYYSKNGLVKCYTCPTEKPIKEMQNGHYISRSVGILRYSEDNCRPQCYGCNCCHSGEQSLFGKLLDQEYGYNISDILMAKKHISHKFTTTELGEIIDKYESKLALLLTDKVTNENS